MRMYELYVTARTHFRVMLHVALRFLQRMVIYGDLENEETKNFNYNVPKYSTACRRVQHCLFFFFFNIRKYF